MDENQNKKLTTITVDIEVQPDGRYDVYMDHDGQSSAHYTDIPSAHTIGNYLTDMILSLID